jgi:prepilin-type N-terminal cleavage/methylation domain-containing protein
MFKAMRQNLKNRKGFTLIELIVVIAIIAILAAVLIPRFVGFSDSAREKSALSDARNILLALEALDAEGKFPNNSTVVTEVNKYLGKEILNTTDAKISGLNNTNGINFKFVKTINGKKYTVTCTDGNLN